MASIKDTCTKLPKSFLKDRTVLFLDSQTGPAHRYIANCSATLADTFSDIGYSFVFLPYLAFNLEPSILGYLFPGTQGAPDVQDMYQRIQKRAGLDGKAGFLYKRGAATFFHAIPDSPDRRIDAEIDIFINYLDGLSATEAATEAATEVATEAEEPEFSIRFSKTCSRRSEEKCLSSYKYSEPGLQFEIAEHKDESPDPKIQKIIAAWEKIEKEFGITLQDLDIILGYRVKLSRMKITTAGKIILTDWGAGTEVKMDDLTKALYFFYLRHPEGATLKELPDFEEEILHFYMSVTGRDDKQEIEKSVHNFLDPFGNSLNVSISRIKKAFKDIVGDRIAKFYYVDGRYAGTRKIALDRDYVIWDH